MSDGALFLLRACAPVYPDLVAEKLPEASELAMLRHFEHCWKLHETLWAVLPGVAAGIGKREAKAHLELLLPAMFKDLRCGNQLCEAAAGRCIGFFRDWLGPTILRGRLDELQRRQLDGCALIPSKVEVPAVEVPQGAGGEGPRPRKLGLAERMRELPPGAPIPNLLAK